MKMSMTFWMSLSFTEGRIFVRVLAALAGWCGKFLQTDEAGGG